MDERSDRDIERVARKIARALFTNNSAEQAERLVLTIDGPPVRNLGGWNETAATNQIAGVLRREWPKF